MPPQPPAAPPQLFPELSPPTFTVSERIQEKTAHKKNRGLIWGTIPFGYKRRKSILTVSDDGTTVERKLLKDTDALRLVLEGYGRGELSNEGGAKYLNAMGYRMKDQHGRRHLFSHIQVRDFGKRHGLRRVRPGGGRHVEARPAPADYRQGTRREN